MELIMLAPVKAFISLFVAHHAPLSCLADFSLSDVSPLLSAAKNCFRNLVLNGSRKGHRTDSCHLFLCLNVVALKFLLKRYVPVA